MQGKHLFEYAVLRIVPRVEREEFINVGVILYCKAEKFLQCRYLLDMLRLTTLHPQADTRDIERHLDAFDRVCKGAENAGPISLLDLPSRFRWLTATRSTVVQTSKVHPGFCTDLHVALQKLYEQLVLVHDTEEKPVIPPK